MFSHTIQIFDIMREREREVNDGVIANTRLQDEFFNDIF